MTTMNTTIYGHTARCVILERHGAGTYDIEVIECSARPELVGQCFRVTGMPLGL